LRHLLGFYRCHRFRRRASRRRQGGPRQGALAAAAAARERFVQGVVVSPFLLFGQTQRLRDEEAHEPGWAENEPVAVLQLHLWTRQ
jgi:hypothetical protein